MANFYGVQTATTPSWTVTNGMSASVIDATGAQTIHIASGGSLDLTGTAGANNIYFDAYNASQLTVERSGMTVIFKAGATEVARISASTDSQSIHFLDATSTLVYNGTTVTLGGTEVTTTASVPTTFTVTNTGGTVTFGGTATGTVTASLSGTDLTFTRGGASASAINVNDVTAINLPDAGVINVALANSLDTANITFHSTDTVTVADTGANIGALTATAINGFNDANINAFNASDNAVTMNVAQANAVDAANMTFHSTDTVTLADTGANIGALTATAINGFNDANINAINASDNAVTLNVAQANAVDAANIAFDATDAVTVVDTGANIGALTATAINGFNDANINAINASDNAVTLNVAQANAVDAGNIAFDATDTVTVVDTGANIGALTATAINGLNDANVNAFNASDNAAALNVTTANAIDSANLTFDATDTVTVNIATGEEAATLVSAVITGYDAANINNFNLADEATTLNVTTANAIDTANMVFHSTDAVTVDIATGEEATTLVSAVIGGYDSANINNINLADNVTGVNVATANAIDSADMVFDATDTVAVADTGANIGGVSAASIGGWNSANINVINASDDAVTLNVAQANAIDTANIIFNSTDTATVVDTGANIGALTVTAINGFNDANINVFNASDNAIEVNLAQSTAFGAAGLLFDASDTLSVLDTGANIGALTATEIENFSSLTINVSDNALTLNVAQANAVDTTDLVFHSTDTVTVNVATGEEAATLVSAVITGYDAANINNFNLADNATTLNVTTANAIDSANMVFHSTDAVTVDVATGEETTTLVSAVIGGYDSANINNINLADNVTGVNVATANAIDSADMVFDATDTVAVADTGANIGGVSAASIGGWNSANINVINASDNAVTLNVAQANAIDTANITFNSTDTATVVDTGANIGALTATAINGFNDANINAFNASDNTISMNLAQASAVAAGGLVFDATDTLTIADTGANIGALTATEINGFVGVNINASDDAVTLNVAQANAVDSTDQVFHSTDTVTVDVATGEEAATLVSAVITGYDTANINNFNLADNATTLNVTTANAIDSANMVFHSTDAVTVDVATGEEATTLVSAVIGGYDSANINNINLADNATAVNVATANAIDTADMVFDATDTVTVADTGANIGGVSAASIGGWDSANINAINASDNAVTLNVAQADAIDTANITFDATDTATVADTGANIGALTVTAINGLNDANINAFNATDDAATLTVSQANAVDAADMVFHSSDAVTVNVTTVAEAATLVSAVISGYDAANINNINLADDATAVNVATANAIDTADMVFDATDTVTVADTGANIGGVSAASIGGWNSANVNAINASDDTVVLNVALANAVDTADMVFDATDTVTVVDTGANIGGVSAASIGGWNSANINAINASDNAVTLDVAKANAIDTADITFDATDTATVADTGANIGALTATAINGLNDANINAFNASDNAVALNVAQANAVDAANMVFHNTDAVTVDVATGEEATTLVSAVIGGYDSANINNINLADNATTLNVTTANAIDTANMVFDATDAVTVDVATGEEATTLVSAVIGGYDSANINNINLADNATTLDVAVANAIDSADMVFDATDVVTVEDTGANIGGVSAGSIGGWNSANINAINASDNAVALNVAQANAIDTADIAFDATDTVTVVDTGVSISGLSTATIAGWNASNINAINTSDNSTAVDIARANAIDTADMTFDATDTVTVIDTGANIGGLTVTAINGFNDANINAFNAADDAVTLNVGQANAIDAANMVFHATDVVTVDIATGEEAATLVSAVIGGYDSAGINNINLADNATTLNVTTANAIDSANMVFDATDAVTVDVATGEEATTLVSAVIGGYDSANINNINLADDATTLNVTTANAIDTANMVFDATDAVTVDVADGEEATTLVSAVIGGYDSANINAINLADNAAAVNVATANAVDTANMVFDSGDTVSVADTGANIGGVSAASIDGWDSANINAINASDDAVTLNVGQANAIDSANMVFDVTDAVTVDVATGEEATTLVSAVIGGYDTANINNINLGDNATTLNVTTANAIDTANMVFDATDTVTVDVATGEEATTLVSAVIGGYGSANINNINLADNATTLDVANANAIDSADMVFDATDVVTVEDTGANIGGVSAGSIGGWNSANINAINASDDAVTLNVAQGNAVDTGNITFDATDTVTVVDTGANIGGLTATAINGFNDANINAFNANTNAVTLNVAQANAVDAANMTFDATDTVTVNVATGEETATLVSAVIGGYDSANINNINLADDATTLNVTTANAIDTANMVFDATDAVTVDVATGEEAATLVAAVIAGYDAANINNINLADNATTLDVTNANAIDSANMVFDVTDAVTVDVADGEEATTLVAAVIAGYDAANINNINLADNATTLDVTNANAIDTADMVFDATDVVTVADALNGVLTTTVVAGWGAANINVLDSSDAVTISMAVAVALDTADIAFTAADSVTIQIAGTDGDSSVDYTDTAAGGSFGNTDTFAIDAAATLTVSEIGINSGDVFSFSGAQALASQAASQAVTDGKYMLIQGSWAGGIFTVDTGAGTDTLVLFDSDATGGAATSGIVLIGIAPAAITAGADQISIT